MSARRFEPRPNFLPSVALACSMACSGRLAGQAQVDASGDRPGLDASQDVVESGAGEMPFAVDASTAASEAGSASNGNGVDAVASADAFAEASSSDSIPVDDATAVQDATVAQDSGAQDASADVLTVTCEGGAADDVCVQYYAYLEKCFNRPNLLGLACQPSLLVTPDADVSSIEALCRDNLQRIQQACR